MSDEVNEETFLKILRKVWLADEHSVGQIEDEVDSPLNYAFRIIKEEMPEDNGRGHSYRVLTNCQEIIKNSRLSLSITDKLVLFYASLLHDTAKSLNENVKNDIKKAVLKQCKLFAHENADHGIRAAHYMKAKRKAIPKRQRIRFYALGERDVEKLLRVISFHSTGRIHSCFMRSGKISRESLLLCLILWVADTADARSFRVEGSETVDEELQDISTQIRKEVKNVKISKNSILWEADKVTKEVERGASWDNGKLAQHRVLLQAFDIPDHIVPVELVTGKKYRNRKTHLSCNDIGEANLCFDVSKKHTPLALSADTLPELYERITEAFCEISVADKLVPKHYFGPTILEVRNVGEDRRKEINIRGETKDFDKLKEYTRAWLGHRPDASDRFYFGYTHGQRIDKYLHIYDDRDLEEALKYGLAKNKDKEKFRDFFKNWTGEISQFKNVIKILRKEGTKARRAYVVIPHVVIDNPMSPLHIPEEVAPALIAIQFIIERGPKLSGFALLRSQELSTFFVVNYLEVRGLLERIQNELKDRFPGIGLGRIAMLSAFGYFQPDTVLLDKPQICKLTISDIRKYAVKMADREKRTKFIKLLQEFEKDFVRIETEWCGRFAVCLSEADHPKASDKMRVLEDSLNKIEKSRKKGGHSATFVRDDKKKAVEKFIRSIRGMSW